MLFRNQLGIINAVGDSYGVDGYASNIGIGEVDQGQYDEVREVFGACAGAALYRRSLLEDIGLFDEDFFLIWEDIDLDFRAQLAGHRCFYIPRAVVYHTHSASIGQYSAKRVFYTARNSLYVLAMNMPGIIMLRYLGRIFRRRLWMAFNAIIHNSLSSFMYGELAFSRQVLKVAAKRFRILANRRVTIKHVNSILIN